MKKDFNKINNIYKAVIILISICLNLYILFIFRNLELSIVLLIFCIFVITIFFIQEKRYEDYIKDSLLDLSQMLQTIIDMKDEEVFSTMEDTIFSKLQYQTIKLTNILNAKNKQMEKERNEIKSLVSDIAHQLKTPLTNLKMYGEFFKDESLSDEERKAALCLSKSVKKGMKIIKEGISAKEVLDEMKKVINQEHLAKIDYVSMVDSLTMEDVGTVDRDVLVAMAVYIGKTRLIDNFSFEVK